MLFTNCDQHSVKYTPYSKYLPPSLRQYFDHIPEVSVMDLASYGGAVEIADYCPFSQEFSWHLSGEYQRNSYCRVQENQPGNIHFLLALFLPLGASDPTVPWIIYSETVHSLEGL